jgi:predicted nucleotidyltransferase
VEEDQLRAVFEALHKAGAEYAVFGAIALGLHGLARATSDVDLFIKADAVNIERLKSALRGIYDDPSIEEIHAVDLLGEYPALRYSPPEGFSFDIVTRLGEAFRFEDLDIETKTFEGVPVRVVTPRTLWRMKRDTVRPTDRYDAQALAERFGFGQDGED